MVFASISDFKQKAENLLPKNAYDYYKSGAGEELSLKLNKDAFDSIKIKPRFLRDVSQRSTACNIFGSHLDMPIGIAPTAMQKMAHPEGEMATARAAGKFNTIFILSSLSTSSIEDVAAAAPNTYKWFQLYVYKDRTLTEDAVRRAERCGYKAIVLTVDAPIFGIRRDDVRNNFKLPSNLSLANFANVMDKVECTEGGSGISDYVNKQFDQTLTWTDVNWLVKKTKLPVIVKGILTKEDAIMAVEAGCKGIIVSNHGARQVDTVQATIQVLPEIVESVGKDTLVMIDGGITQGTDVFKALALGAKFVFFGRPAIWGLAIDGQKGVEEVLQILKNDFSVCMALTGTRTLDEITKNYVIVDQKCCKL